MGSQATTAGSPSCRTIRRYGRPRPWPTISTRSRSFLIRLLEPPTSIVFPATKSIVLVSQPLPDSRTSINTPIIVNDQVGLSRATTGCVIACLFKEFQINASFEGLVETVPGMNLDLLKMDKYTMDPAK